MTPTHLTVTTNMPEPPSADFAFRVDFKRGEGPASRVFAATHAFIKACEAVDLELVTSVDANINPVMVLEDVEAGSLKTFLKTVLESTDNQAIKELDWKPAVGKYLVKAKYLILRWIETDDNNRDLQSLRRDIHTLAEATDVRHIPAYAPPSSSALITAIRDFDAVKTHLVVGDEAAMIVSDDEVASFNISSRIDITSLESLATRETQVHSVPSMVLVVKRPDYLGNSQWDFRHGKKAISAKMEHSQWLEEFQQRRIDVRPGDALRCRVRIEVLYGYDNELMAERYHIEQVYGVLDNQQGPSPLGAPLAF